MKNELEDLTNEMLEASKNMNFDSSFQKDFNAVVPRLAAVIQKKIGTAPRVGSGGGTGAVLEALASQSKGILSITVTRTGGEPALSMPLPYVLFASKQFASSYLAVLKGLMPALVGFNTTLGGVTVDPATGDVLFNYWLLSDHTKVDTIRVHLTGTQDYKSFLDGLTPTSYFKTKGALYTISDTAQQIQFFETVSLGKVSQLGRTEFDSITPNSLDFGTLFKTTKVHFIIGEERIIDNEYAFVENIIAAASFKITWDFFMSDKVGF